jgi:hypothetical protein
MTLSRDAWERLNRYLDEMRASMAGSTPADMADVEQDIRDHIGAELADRSAPVSVGELETVLQRLGSPRQWAADHVPARPASSSGVSTEDRLAYVTAGSMVLFLAFPPLLVLSWLLARWTLARIEERGEPLGARQWLLYPPIVIVVTPVAVIGLLWAFAPFAELGGAIYNQPRLFASPAGDIIGAVTVALVGLGVYWIFLGAALAFGDRLVRVLFYPFAEGFRRRYGWWLSGVGAALAAAAAATFVFLGGR